MAPVPNPLLEASQAAPAAHPLRQLQQLELHVMDDFARLCERHGLRYYLVYGTLIGAVRHHGFIPWDDDVDVAMPRRDYERLAELLEADLGDRYVLSSHRSDGLFPHIYAKLWLRGTRVRQQNDTERSFARGVGIDIFPLDGAPRSAVAQQLRRLVVRAFQIRLSFRVADRQRQRRWLRFLVRLLPLRLIRWLYDSTIRAWPETGADKWICAGPYPDRQTFPRNWFGDGTPLEFEGRRFVAPHEWHRYLTQVYGEYMRLPPVEQRVSRHSLVDVDLGDMALRREPDSSVAPADQA
jgi:lipopolysaccharide cholinephosphotransferase